MANQASQSKWSGAMGVVQEKFPSTQRKERRLSVIGNATTAATAIGMAVPSTTGTATARNFATTNNATQTARLGYVSAAVIGSSANLWGGVANLWRGSRPGAGGFGILQRFVVSDAAAVAGALMFVGLAATTSVIGANTEPTSVFDCVGVGQVSTSGNLHFVWNKASGTGTKIDLGSDFLATDTTALYCLEIFCDHNDPSRAIAVSITNETNGAHTRIVIPGDHATVPTLTTPMTYHFARSNNTATPAVGIDIVDAVIYTRV
jgi:hypothetical protein